MVVTDTPLGPTPRRVGVVVSAFNQVITDRLLDGALQTLEKEGVSEVVVARVPGALELAITAGALIRAGCEAVVAIAAVIKGETDHYEYVAAETMAGLTRIALDTGRPIGNAVLTVRDATHAEDRSLPGPSNKGAEAARAAIQTHRTLTGVLKPGFLSPHSGL